MPSTVYKGDLSEVTLGKEAGLLLTSANSAGHASGSPQTFTWVVATVANANTSTLTLQNGIANSPVLAGKLRYPEGMLVGSTLTFHSSNGTSNFAADDFTRTGISYNIIAFTASVITVTPALKTAHAEVSDTGDSLYINSLGTPTIDVGMTHATNADASDETILADQFIGLAATVKLPDTKNEIKRQHVVGIGRDVVVQVAGKQQNEGGTIDVMLNSPRWFYYALGRESFKDRGASGAIVSGTLAVAASAGDCHLTLSALTSIAVGDYISIEDDSNFAEVPGDDASTQTTGTGGTSWPDSTAATGFKFTETNEIRRVVALNGSNSSVTKMVWLDDPLHYHHVIGKNFRISRYDTGSANQSPDVDSSTLLITNPSQRLLYSGWYVPSFCLEHSIRNRDVGAYSFETGALTNQPSSSSDAKTLTRVFRGCKVKDWALSADADAEVKLSLNFDALSVYTDTGRLEGVANDGDRYTAHRMFENTGNTPINRKIAGIAPYTQKPYLFYNGVIKAFGQQMARVTKFNLTGKNNIKQHWTIRGTDAATGAVTEQVPFAGTRFPNLSVEGKTEYDLSMTVIIDDPLLWHELRHAKEHVKGSNPVELTVTKQGTGPTREQIIITIDDYIIEEAPIPVPEDKGVLTVEVKLKPKHVKVESFDTLFHC